ncbi:hypothetical protein KKG46_04245 [Patescibacteria group bacterium]|nr:hypothetical protein [Patescibacteria group bacterium]
MPHCSQNFTPIYFSKQPGQRTVKYDFLLMRVQVQHARHVLQFSQYLLAITSLGQREHLYKKEGSRQNTATSKPFGSFGAIDMTASELLNEQ